MNTIASTSLTLTDELTLEGICWTRLAQAVVDQSIPHIVYDTWATSAEGFGPWAELAISSYRGEHFNAVLVDLAEPVGEACMASLGLHHGYFTVWLAAWSRDGLTIAREWLRAQFPLDTPGEEPRVGVHFWTAGAGGGQATSRKIDVEGWEAVRTNYPTALHTPLGGLMARGATPGRGGQLILWHGPPGTGKTSALRALAWEWRAWCELHYVTDPEVLFGNAGYLMSVLLNEAENSDEDDGDAKWRLLVLEDTGELLSADAKERTGQGLSRLLNVVDGIVGQGLRLLVLVTTNEPLGGLHPAVTRPGRCLASIEFPTFGAQEAATWLAERGHVEVPTWNLALAEMFALISGEDVPTVRRRAIGFAPSGSS
jgi:ATPase family associated with various cellular activities (AAA)